MTITAYPKTPLQIATFALATSLASNSLNSEASEAIINFFNIESTPSFAQKLAFSNALAAAKLAAVANQDAAAEIAYIDLFLNLVNGDLALEKIGTDADGLILNNVEYPLDDLGVTADTLLADFNSIFSDSTNTDTVEHFADAIFYTLKALSPNLTLEQLTADIQATIDTGVELEDLVSSISNSLASISSASSSTMSSAFYGTNIFSSEQANLANDIQSKEILYNYNQMKTALKNACSNPTSDAATFAAAIYNALLLAGVRNLSQTEIFRGVVAGANAVSGLPTLKSNILSNLNNIDDLSTTEDLLADAVYNTGCLIYPDPHDLKGALEDANTLLAFQYMRTALMSATNNFSGTATQLGQAILNALSSIGAGTSLTLEEIVNDINNSGSVTDLAANIYSALAGLNANSLVAADLTDSIYGEGLIVSGHPLNLFNDVTEAQVISNYNNMKSNMATQIGLATDAEGIRDAIYTNIAGSNLSAAALLADINQSIALSDLATVKTNLVAALNNATPSAVGISEALYIGANSLTNAEPYQAAADIAAVETALDYKTMLEDSIAVCDAVVGVSPTITTVSGFVNALLAVPNLFASITISTTPAVTAAFLQDAITRAQPRIWEDLPTIVNAIKEDLQSALTNKEFNAGAIDNAVFGNIAPEDDHRAYQDLVIAELEKSLFAIKSNLIANDCHNSVSGNPSNTCATSVLTALVNGNVMTPTLTTNSLRLDFEATIATGATLTEIMTNIASNLNALPNNGLTANNIATALYAENALVSSNPYRFGFDLENAESNITLNAIYDALVDYLTSISTSNVDISAISMARGMLAALNINGGDISGGFDTNLASNIAYTMSQDTNDYGTGLYLMAQDLLESLALVTDKTSSNIVTALMNVIHLTSDTCSGNTLVVAPENVNDNASLISYIDTVVSNSNLYSTITATMISNLQGLTPDYGSSDVASAITSALSLSSDYTRLLSSNMLVNNIDATSGTLAQKVTALITALQSLSNPEVDDVLAALFAFSGDQGALADSTSDLQALVADTSSSAALTNKYQDIVNQLTSNLQTVAFDSYGAAKTATVTAIYDGINTVTNGANGKITSAIFTTARIGDNIDATCGEQSVPLTCLSTKVTNIIDGLVNLSGNNLSADGIRNVLFDDSTALYIGTSESVRYYSDLENAAQEHSSLGTIKNAFSTVGTYGSSSSLTTALLTKIAANTGVTLTLSTSQLTADIDSTLANNSGLNIQGLASSTINAVYNAPNTADAMAAAMFANILPTANQDNVKADAEAYKLARESQYYGNIVNSFIGNFNINNAANYDTAEEFATLLVATLADSGLTNPTWTFARVLSDVLVSNPGLLDDILPLLQALKPGGSVTYPGGNPLYTGGTALNNAQDITDAIYSVLTLSEANKDALNTDIATPVLLYGGANGLASLVYAALSSTINTNTDAATAIVRAITPLAVNVSPLPSISDMVEDFVFTEEFSNTNLAAIVNAIKTALQTIISDPSTTIDTMNAAFYDVARLVASNNDKLNFDLDLYNSATGYNNYAAIKTALAGINTDSASSTATSILATLALTSNTIDQAQLTSSLENSVVTTYADLMTTILSNLGTANIGQVSTAAKALSYAFYNLNALQSRSEANMSLDLTNAAAIDNAVSLTSVMGGGVCKVGATHTVYSCSASNGVKTVGSEIATNNCTVSGLSFAEEACVAWSLNGEDHYISFDGVTCSNYLSPSSASLACQQGLDYLVG